jgi:type I restriction enzyme S subunit
MSAELERGEWPFAQLPDTWSWASFDDVANDVTSDRKLQQRSYATYGAYPVIDQGQQDVAGFTDDESLVHPTSDPVIVFGDHTRAIKLVAPPFVQGADGVRVLRPSGAVDARFLYWALRTVRLPDKGYSRHFKFLKQTLFPVAPLSEQHRIVSKLDQLLTSSRAAGAALDAVPMLLEQYVHAVLDAGFRGELTADVRRTITDDLDARAWLQTIGHGGEVIGHDKATTELPSSWVWSELGRIVDCFDGRRVPLEASIRKKRQGPYPYYGASGPIDSIDDHLFEGDYLLIAEDGANLLSRRTPIAFQATGRFWVNNHAHVVRTRGGMPLAYLEAFLNSYDLSRIVTGSAQPKLTQKALLSIPVPIAPLVEQGVICSRLSALSTATANMREKIEGADEQRHILERSVLERAFRGELVERDPADEPAVKLLERVQSWRRAAGRTTGKELRSSRLS